MVIHARCPEHELRRSAQQENLLYNHAKIIIFNDVYMWPLASHTQTLHRQTGTCILEATIEGWDYVFPQSSHAAYGLDDP